MRLDSYPEPPRADLTQMTQVQPGHNNRQFDEEKFNISVFYGDVSC